MYLQLAENSSYTPPSVYMAERLIKVRGYQRKSRVRPHLRRLSEEEQNPYVYIPAHISGLDRGLMVREDNFDDMSNEEWKGMMWQLAPYQAPVQNQQVSEQLYLSGLFGSRASRQAKRQEHEKSRSEKKAAKTEIKKAKAEQKRSGEGGSVFGDILDTAKNIFGKKDEAPDQQEASMLPGTGGGKILGMNPMTAGLVGLGIVVVGGGIALSQRKRRRK